MSRHPFPAPRRVNRLAVLLAVMAAILAPLAFSLGSIANADTSANNGTDPNVRVAFGPQGTATASNGLQPCGTAGGAACPAASTLKGAVDGSVLSIHADSNGSNGTLLGITRAELCDNTVDVTTSADMNSSNGDCMSGAFSGSTAGNFTTVSADSGHNNADTTIAIGEGTSGAIQCDSTHPCTLWIDIQTNNDTSNHVFKHYAVTYTGQPGAPTVNVTPGISKLTVDVTPPMNDGNTANPPGLTYHLTVSGGDCPTPAGCAAQNGTGTHYVLQPVTAGQTYTVHVTATSTAANGTTTFTGPEGTGTGTPVSAPSTAVTQTIYASRPNGALVLTQVCTGHPAGSSGPPASPGFPGQTAGAPTYNGSPDPLFSQYPYPTAADGTPGANYPTNCNVDLGVAKLVTSGPNAGQVFQASGNLSEVTVVDTRDTDPGWNAVGNMGTFQNAAQPVGPRATFGGAHLGWVPANPQTSPTYTDPDGTTYTQTVSKGATIAPDTADGAGCSGTTPANFACAGGLGSGALLAKGATGSSSGTALTGGLGIARLDAALNLYIPLYALGGEYSGVLTISAV